MEDDQKRQDATSRDRSPNELYSLSIDEVADMYEEAGFPRTPRAIQRYCALDKLDCHKAETPTGERYLVAPYSVERHIKYIKEVSRPGATSRDNSRPDATIRPLGNKVQEEPRQATTSPDQTRQVATVREEDSRYVAALERENDFLRGEISVKNTQIHELTERSKETNTLIHRLQSMLAPLLIAPENRNGGEIQ
ncbi:hypothetical protein KMZ29_06295 [Bradyrhizobium sediminis]|uniref:Uncharacterized protein n=1 Tax=Bradyrhizobium sediminis TaxID=2840469 RepID=A0A975NGT8_9BRAD|nr:hypothetical protein [Bradyrhizobium sediminis]QWG14291.1 hypothetical protein KMZ29_06295 [Bradyrhizobium sediminis]